MKQKVNILLKPSLNDTILLTMTIQDISKDSLINEGNNYKLLLSKSSKKKDLNLLVKMILPIEIIDNYKDKLINNIVVKQTKKGLFTITYSYSFPFTALNEENEKAVITIIDKKMGLQYQFPKKLYRKKLFSYFTKKISNQTNMEALKPERKQKANKKNKRVNIAKSNHKTNNHQKINSMSALSNQDSATFSRSNSFSHSSYPLIRNARDTAFKRCGNCLNLNKYNDCVKHKRPVSIHNTCDYFYSPKSLLWWFFFF